MQVCPLTSFSLFSSELCAPNCRLSLSLSLFTLSHPPLYPLTRSVPLPSHIIQPLPPLSPTMTATPLGQLPPTHTLTLRDTEMIRDREVVLDRHLFIFDSLSSNLFILLSLLTLCPFVGHDLTVCVTAKTWPHHSWHCWYFDATTAVYKTAFLFCLLIFATSVSMCLNENTKRQKTLNAPLFHVNLSAL